MPEGESSGSDSGSGSGSGSSETTGGGAIVLTSNETFSIREKLQVPEGLYIPGSIAKLYISKPCLSVFILC